MAAGERTEWHRKPECSSIIRFGLTFYLWIFRFRYAPWAACGFFPRHALPFRSIQKLKLLNWQHGDLFTTGGQNTVSGDQRRLKPWKLILTGGITSEILSLLSLLLLLLLLILLHWGLENWNNSIFILSSMLLFTSCDIKTSFSEVKLCIFIG